VRGFLLAAYDTTGNAVGYWSDIAGYTQNATCGQNGVVTTPTPGGTPGFKVNSGSVGSHTSLLGTLTRVYTYLNVTWTSPPVAQNLTFSGVIVSDKIYNSLLPLYFTSGVQGATSLPATSAVTSNPATSNAATSNPATSAAVPTSAVATSVVATTPATTSGAGSLVASLLVFAAALLL